VYYTRTNAGQLLDERTTTGAYYYLMDDLGSVANVVDSTSTVKNSYRYDPFGTSTSKTEAVSNPWQFASGYLDANTGLYKFGERYYDPQVGRWTQKDPVGGSLGSVNSTNPYVYADNLPNMLVDPTGRFGGYASVIDIFLSCLGVSLFQAALYLAGAAALLSALCGSSAGLGCLSAVPTLNIVAAILGIPPVAICLALAIDIAGFDLYQIIKSQ